MRTGHLIVVIVGVSPQSLGESMAEAFAAHSPALLVLASRTRSKIERVTAKVKERHPDVRLESVELDLSSFESIRACAAIMDNLVDRIDILVNNAAVVVVEHTFTKEGIELQFGTNHVGLFLLTNLLMPKILTAAQVSPVKGSTRIVNVTSAGHALSPIRFSDHSFRKRPEDIPMEERPPATSTSSNLKTSLDPPDGETYAGFVAYGQAKTANILFSLSLNTRLRDRGIRSIAVHPGSIRTDLSRNLDEKHNAIIETTGGFWKNLDQGSATMLVAALDPKLAGLAGSDNGSHSPKKDDGIFYLSDCQIAQPAGHASDPKAAERLWALSEDLVGQRFDLTS